MVLTRICRAGRRLLLRFVSYRFQVHGLDRLFAACIALATTHDTHTRISVKIASQTPHDSPVFCFTPPPLKYSSCLASSLLNAPLSQPLPTEATLCRLASFHWRSPPCPSATHSPSSSARLAASSKSTCIVGETAEGTSVEARLISERRSWSRIMRVRRVSSTGRSDGGKGWGYCEAMAGTSPRGFTVAPNKLEWQFELTVSHLGVMLDEGESRVGKHEHSGQDDSSKPISKNCAQ